MPITKQALKKLRHDRERTKQNEIGIKTLHNAIKKARKAPTASTVSEAFSAADKAAKHHTIHKNAAARLKARLAKLLKK